MAREVQKTVLDILRNLRGLEPLKQLFWSELNYERVNQPLSRHGWSDTATSALTEDPVLFAGGGESNDFHVIYGRLASDRLLLGQERPVVSRLIHDHPYVLFIFSNAAQDRWHFINIKYDKEIIKRRLFRRITIGPEERLRTASERVSLLDLTELSDLSPLVIQERHDEAFDVEAVQKDFFRVFAELYHKVADDISKIHGLEKESGKLAQLLLNRMLFLYFIQKKGWLDQKLDYLYSRFQDCWKKDPRGNSYYSGILYPLFICLSNSAMKIDTVGAVPFLNGGLFEEAGKQTQAERLEQARLQIKNTTFKAIFDDLLERFNFTVTEDTPIDIEVAIDPEMLGKIFESLILQLEKDPDKDLRKLTGSYYTPRPIVHFMCQEALKEHLVTQLVGDDAKKSEMVRKKVGKLLSLPPADHLDDEQVKTLVGLFTDTEAKTLRQAILDCRVCDPAVGSGAFPVGMLHEMVAAIARLDYRLHGRTILLGRNYDYDLKKQIIESSLYGVDIQEQAVRLCELRLWLSLIVDYQIDPSKPFDKAISEVPSLPNLSYRIVRGDSLLEHLFGYAVQLDEMAKDAKTKQHIESIQADKQAYFREGDTTEKRRLELKILAKQADLAERLIEAKRAAVKGYSTGMFGEEAMKKKERMAKVEYETQIKELDDLKRKVSEAKFELERINRQKTLLVRGDIDTLRRKFFRTGDAPTFMWRIDFAEVFENTDGFDILVGNPPYGIIFDELRKKELTNLYASFARNNDIFAAFTDLSARLLNQGSTFVLITPNTYLIGPYFDPLKRSLLLKGTPVRIIDFGNQKVFPDPSVFTSIQVFHKNPNKIIQNNHVDPLVLDTAAVTTDGITILSTTKVTNHKNPPFSWAPTSSLEEKIRRKAESLETWCIVKDVGFNYWTVGRGKVRGGSIGSRILYSGKRLHQKDKPFIKGKDVQPFLINEGSHFLRHDYQEYLDPNIDVFRFTSMFLERNPKIVYRQTADKIIAAVDKDARYTDKTVHLIVFKDENAKPFSYEYLTGILNSKLITYIYRKRAREEGRLFAQVKVFRVKSLPISAGSDDQRKQLEEVVKKLERKGLDEYRRQELEDKLNVIVNKIYGLNEDDISFIVNND